MILNLINEYQYADWSSLELLSRFNKYSMLTERAFVGFHIEIIIIIIIICRRYQVNRFEVHTRN